MKPRLPFRAICAAAVLALAAAGCGEDVPDLIEEDSLRDCLTEAGSKVEAPDVGSAARLGNVSPDFRVMTADGVAVDVVVQGTPEKAERTAANIQGALLSFGVEGSEVVSAQNAVVIFEKEPSSESRAAVADCLGADAKT